MRCINKLFTSHEVNKLFIHLAICNLIGQFTTGMVETIFIGRSNEHTLRGRSQTGSGHA